MEIVLLFVAFKRQTNEVPCWCGLSMLLRFRTMRLLLKRLLLGEISFLLLSLVWTSDIFSVITLKLIFLLRIPMGINIHDWLTNHRSILIFPLLFDYSANQMHWSTSVGRVSLSMYQILIGHLIKPQYRGLVI